jgi:hypothetical protein
MAQQYGYSVENIPIKRPNNMPWDMFERLRAYDLQKKKRKEKDDGNLNVLRKAKRQGVAAEK